MNKKVNRRRPNGCSSSWLLPENPGDDFLTGAEWITLAGAARLTTREVVVATLLLKGRTRKGIAHRLKLSPETVRVHIDALFTKFQVRDRLGLALRIARIREVIQAAPERV
ncbi:MAG: LuxR C-terminal-related transcriptional regulator [Gemmataceae bacterium]|nr:LuxR C-terminal-related transcriptional regulator [Gemmataceae bacterium]